jgi:hypothetical protein
MIIFVAAYYPSRIPGGSLLCRKDKRNSVGDKDSVPPNRPPCAGINLFGMVRRKPQSPQNVVFLAIKHGARVFQDIENSHVWEEGLQNANNDDENVKVPRSHASDPKQPSQGRVRGEVLTRTTPNKDEMANMGGKFQHFFEAEGFFFDNVPNVCGIVGREPFFALLPGASVEVKRVPM